VARRLHEGFAAWRRLGPVAGARALLTLLSGRVRDPVRRAWLRARPPRVSGADVATALGNLSPVEALRGPALGALPTVAAWEQELDALAAQERADLLRRADDVLAHRFDLLGSGPVELGPEIDWQRDFKSGRNWPLAHITVLPIVYPDDSDIKVPWELSRFQHLPLLAAAYHLTGEPAYLDELGAQLDSWITANPVEFGANWACTMDVAIRASNWVAALALCAERAHEALWFDRALASLLLHGRFIRSHLEAGEVRGNHYLANVVGLLPVAALFSRGGEGRRWAEWAAGELPTEMEHQVRVDGCDHEASVPYHRLVTELFVLGARGVDSLLPGRLSNAFRERLDAMLAFTAGYTRPDALSPQIGDADDGRFLPLGDYAKADPRSHVHLFDQAARPRPAARGRAGYPYGGYYVMRAAELYVIVRCGDTGLYGVGAHAHNDQLALELCVGAAAFVVDPGAYIYTADPVARNLFRSTRFHSTLSVGGAEQNELRADYLFSMADRTRAECLSWEPRDSGAVFEGRHHGFEFLDPPTTHTRRLQLDAGARTLSIRDTVTVGGGRELEWSFPLDPSVRAERQGSVVVAEASGTRLMIAGEGLDFTVDDGWYSPSYGVRQRTAFVRARRRAHDGVDVQEILLTAS
jgi:uncharacterized heparinase superfamily protein